MSTPLPIRLAQTLAISTSLIFVGLTLAYTYFVIPTILQSYPNTTMPPAVLLQQWKTPFVAGKYMPHLALSSALPYLYLSYSTPHTLLYLVAGGAAIGVVPITLAVVMPTNRRLLALEEKEERRKGSVGEKETRDLVARWGLLNLSRTASMSVAALVGLWTALSG